ncbi:MAG: hypothetical protein D6739_02605 [Nitrospirae bacterium]|nr:MAG: hypothetical protein D6739_02605 [Nitrospirota bacterium]
MKRLLTLAAVAAALWPVAAPAAMDIELTKHNLSMSGPGQIKATSLDRICIFCHTPHRASSTVLLWNRADPTTTYIPYSSSTAPQAVGQPTGSSRLCLSCHDGTIALGALGSMATEVQMTQRFLDTGPAALGTDLSDDHPISFVYDTALSNANPEYKDPSLLLEPITLDANGELQCSTCHDPHDDTFGDFLRMDNRGSALCLQCHQPTGWSLTPHSQATNTWNGQGADPWPHTSWTTVADNGCENCHRPHGAGGHARLLNAFTEEDNCFPCHDGSVAPQDLTAEFQKVSHHPVELAAGVHDPAESPSTMGRHVECADCHDPHQAKPGSATPPAVSPPIAGVSGVDSSGAVVSPAQNQYEICFKCHADTAQGLAPIPRQIQTLNKRLQFDPANPSFHPVEAPGVNPNVPSLILPLTTASVIYCTDCHASDDGPGAGGTGPAGPHGSVYPYLLEREYVTADNTAESPTVYALCYKCHDRNSILADQSFSEHSKHLSNKVNAPCSACHDPHGISNGQGTTTNNSHLINFDTSIVQPYNGVLKFEDLGTFTGRCTLVCHGKSHKPKTYP